MHEKNKKYPEGHFVGMWMGIGIAIFSVLGLPVSILTGNSGMIGVGPAIGVAFGLAIGQGIENKYKKEGKIRPLTKEEKNKIRMAITAGIVMLLLGVAAFLFMFFRS